MPISEAGSQVTGGHEQSATGRHKKEGSKQPKANPQEQTKMSWVVARILPSNGYSLEPWRNVSTTKMFDKSRRSSQPKHDQEEANWR